MKIFAIGVMVLISVFSFTGCTNGTERHILEYETIIIEGNEYPTSEVKNADYVAGSYTIEMKDGTYFGGASIILKDKKN